jgi:hypothetical protein
MQNGVPCARKGEGLAALWQTAELFLLRSLVVLVIVLHEESVKRQISGVTVSVSLFV